MKSSAFGFFDKNTFVVFDTVYESTVIFVSTRGRFKRLHGVCEITVGAVASAELAVSACYPLTS
jgi:hypothetical protein